MIKIFLLLLIFTSCSTHKFKEGPIEYLHSTKTTALIRAELLKRQGIDSFKINIVTTKGIIYLDGLVPYLHQKLLAQEIAKMVSNGEFKVKANIKISNKTTNEDS